MGRRKKQKGKPLAECQKTMAILWFCFAGAFILLFIIQTITRYYEPHTTEAWGWLMSTFMPTLSVISGAFITIALKPALVVRYINRSFFRLTLLVSIFYLLVVSMTILLYPLAFSTPLEYFSQANLWISPLQGLSAATLGGMFFKESKDE